MKLKYKGIIFDCDGTLIDTLGDISVSMNKALKLHGFPELTNDEYKDKVGWGIKRLAYLSLPEEKRNMETATLVAGDAINFYTEEPLITSFVYPGILELVITLKGKKLKTAVLTNKPNVPAQLVINGLFPPNTFNFVRGEIKGKPRKPDPACVWDLLVNMNLTPAEVIFVGDSEIDMETALAAGCFPLGVSWGYRSRETLENAGAKRIIDKPAELLELL